MCANTTDSLEPDMTITQHATAPIRAIAMTCGVIREQWYWLTWLAFIVLDLYSARQVQYAPWLLSHYVWWVAPFVLWITMPRLVLWPRSGLLALLVLSWIASTLLATAEHSLIGWLASDLPVPLGLIRFPLKYLLAAAAISLALAHLTVKLFGPRASRAALIIGLVAGCSIERANYWWSWQNGAPSFCIHVFGTFIFALVFAAGTARLHLASPPANWKPGRLDDAATPPPKAWFIGFPAAVICAQILIVLGEFLIPGRQGQGVTWIEQVASSLGALALVSWAGKHALRRTLYGLRSQRLFQRIGARTGAVLIWTGLLAVWVPVASWTWKERGQELEDLLAAASGPMWTLTVSQDGSTLHFSGIVAAGLGNDVQAMLGKNPSISTLDLSSGGGSVGEAYDIAKLVKDKALVTLVRDHCESACTILFAAGRQRLLGDDGMLGYHDESRYGLPSNRSLEEKLAPERRYGIDEAFQVKALKVPHWDIWYPGKRELLRAGVVTKVGTIPEVEDIKELRIGSWVIGEPDRNGAFSASASGTGALLSQGCMADLAKCSWFVATNVPCERPALIAVRVSATHETQSLMARCKLIEGNTYLTFEDPHSLEVLLAQGDLLEMAIPRAGSSDLVLHFDVGGAGATLAYMHKTIARLMPAT
jgi:hypothetical protein